jgi:hypothetical protein
MMVALTVRENVAPDTVGTLNMIASWKSTSTFSNTRNAKAL